MDFRRLSENDLSSFVENIKELLAGPELSAIDPAVRAALLIEIGTLPEDLATQTADAEVAKAVRSAAVTVRNGTLRRTRKVTARVRGLLETADAPKAQFDLCGFDYAADPVGMYVAQNPTELSAVGYFNGVNRLKFKGNNKRRRVVYQIWRRTSRDTAFGMHGTTTKQSFSDDPVTPGQFYEYKVRAVAPKSDSQFSNPAIVYGMI